jgi:hypothetical protein
MATEFVGVCLQSSGVEGDDIRSLSMAIPLLEWNASQNMLPVPVPLLDCVADLILHK